MCFERFSSSPLLLLPLSTLLGIPVSASGGLGRFALTFGFGNGSGFFLFLTKALLLLLSGQGCRTISSGTVRSLNIAGRHDAFLAGIVSDLPPVIVLLFEDDEVFVLGHGKLVVALSLKIVHGNTMLDVGFRLRCRGGGSGGGSLLGLERYGLAHRWWEDGATTGGTSGWWQRCSSSSDGRCGGGGGGSGTEPDAAGAAGAAGAAAGEGGAAAAVRALALLASIFLTISLAASLEPVWKSRVLSERPA